MGLNVSMFFAFYGLPLLLKLREAAIESDVRMIACQMTMDIFEYGLEDMIEGPEYGGAAPWY